MTLFGLLWVAHLPSILGIIPAPVALLGDVVWLGRYHPVAQIALAPMAPDQLGPAPATEPAPITPLQSLESRPLQDLGTVVDWQRWTNTAVVTVVATTPTENTPAADLRPNDLDSITCPAAHPQHSEAQRLDPIAAASAAALKSAQKRPNQTTPEVTTPEVTTSGDTNFVIRVKGVAIGQVTSADVAEQVATDLRQAMPVLAKYPQDLAPTMEGNTGIGQLQDQAIFSLSPSALDTDESVALTTAQWVNNLRLALGATPLNPGQVQRVAYGLDHTSTRLQGTASWYGPYFHGRQTATGEIFDQNALTAAHKTLPFDTYLEVRNLLNGKTVVVRINDRGPYVGDRSLDLSYAAAHCLGSVKVGLIPYEATILTPGDPQAWEEAALPL